MNEPREPVLSVDDERVWATWQLAAAAHARTHSHRRRVDSTLRLLDRAQPFDSTAAVSWSGGKDSTVMTHVVCVRFGAPVDVISEKDDLDFPGEEAYVRALAETWRLRLHVAHPDVSPEAWVREHLEHPGDEIHARSSGLSKACFYPVIARFEIMYRTMMLGLRSEESAIRAGLRRTRGRDYRLRDGRRRLLPIADWTGLDVYAYAQSNGIEFLPLYRCLAFMHADAPWRLRKSWWLPGCGASTGQIAWLRRYYPSLYRKLCVWMPDARRMA